MMSTRVGTDIAEAARLLSAGGVVAMPTETVYGLAALARDADAVRRVYSIKGRPLDHPLIVHVANEEAAREWAGSWSPTADALAKRFWPGPLTLIVDRADFVPDFVTGGRPTVALRVPSHPLAIELLRRVDDGLAAPSANRFGRVSPTTAEHVRNDLGDDVDYVLDGGACDVGLESTIVDCSVDPPQILRPGGVAREDIEAVVRTLAPMSGPSRAPGMLDSHYAPNCRVVLRETDDESEPRSSGATRTLDASVDPSSFARDMYAHLRNADSDGIETLVITLPAPHGIGLAIRDRLRKASAQR
jgi:L-threonylcarbamoyladenylate synthase